MNAATTDSKGAFNIRVNLYDSLEFSFVGYKSQSVFVTDSRPMTIVMEGEVGSLNEVSVVAYSRQKKASVLGSITTIKPEELKIPSSNLTAALAGRVAGMISYRKLPGSVLQHRRSICLWKLTDRPEVYNLCSRQIFPDLTIQGRSYARYIKGTPWRYSKNRVRNFT